MVLSTSVLLQGHNMILTVMMRSIFCKQRDIDFLDFAVGGHSKFPKSVMVPTWKLPLSSCSNYFQQLNIV
jgi:hypothetical protein